MVTLPVSALGYIREKTHHLHEELETQLEIIPRLKSPTQRDPLISAYRTMHRRAVAALAPWLGRIEGLVQFPWPGEVFAATPDAEIDGCEGWRLTHWAEVLGFYYVMQGAMLGGRVMLRELQSECVDTSEFVFLDPHGERTGQVWRDTKELLERALADNDAALDLAVDGARKGYAFAFDCLRSRVAT